MTIPQCFVAMTAAVLSWTCLFTSSARGQAVEVSDPNVEAAIRAEINKPTGDLTAADLLKVVELDLQGKELSTVTIPEGLTNLEVLDLSVNSLAGGIFNPVTFPDDLTSLTTLDLSRNDLSSAGSIGFISKMPALQRLDLSFNERSQLAIPDTLTNLVELTATNNEISDITLPEGLGELVTIDLSFNQIESLTIPPGYVKLEELRLNNNVIAEFNLSDDLESLSILAIESNSLESLTIPSGLSNLTSVTAFSNSLTNLRLPDDLFNLLTLDIEANELETLRLPVGMDSIQGLQIRFNDNLTTIYLPEYLDRYLGTLEFAAPDAEIVILPMDPEITQITQLEDGSVELLLVARESTYVIYRSTDLIEWQEFDDVISFGSRTFFVDEEAADEPAVFYRVEEIPEQ